MSLGIEYSHSSIMTDVLAAVIKFRFQVLRFLYYRLGIQIVDTLSKSCIVYDIIKNLFHFKK